MELIEDNIENLDEENQNMLLIVNLKDLRREKLDILQRKYSYGENYIMDLRMKKEIWKD